MLRLTLMVLLLVPAASALEVAVEGVPEDPLEPDVETASVTLVALIPCEEVAPRITQEGTVIVVWALDASPGILLTGAQSAAGDGTGCLTAPTTPLRVETPMEIGISRSEPGLIDLPIEVTATVQGGGVSEEITASTSISVQADAFLLIQPKAAMKVRQGSSDKDTPFPIELENFGNVRTEVHFSLVEEPERARVLLPSPIVLLSPNSGEEPTSITTEVMLRPERGATEEVQILVTPVAADDPTKTGEPTAINLLIRDGSFLGRVTPAPTLLPLLLLIGLAAARLPRNDR